MQYNEISMSFDALNQRLKWHYHTNPLHCVLPKLPSESSSEVEWHAFLNDLHASKVAIDTFNSTPSALKVTNYAKKAASVLDKFINDLPDLHPAFDSVKKINEVCYHSINELNQLDDDNGELIAIQAIVSNMELLYPSCLVSQESVTITKSCDNEWRIVIDNGSFDYQMTFAKHQGLTWPTLLKHDVNDDLLALGC